MTRERGLGHLSGTSRANTFCLLWVQRVEMRFAHLKIQHGFERMRLRGLSGARDEFHLAAIVQNLKTLALRALGPPAALHSASFA